MKRRGLGIAIALVLAGTPVAAGSTGPDPLVTARLLRLADSPALPDEVREAWRAAVLYQYEDSIVAPIGDFDQDGITDVVQWRINFDGRLGQESVIDARSGRDGSLLWSYDPPDVPTSTSGRHLLYPAVVGPDGRDGLIMAEVNGYNALGGSVATGAVYGIDHTGAQVWYYQAPSVFPVAVLNALPGKATDVLLASYADHARPLLVDGSSGRLVQPAGWSATAYDVAALPDVSGDGLDDYGVLEDGDRLLAYSGASGGPLWSRTWASHAVTTVDRIGDMTGDRRHEAGLRGYDITAAGALVTSDTTVVDGATGRRLWSRRGALKALGDITGDRRGEAMAVTPGNGSLTVEAYDAAGRRRWVARLPSPGHGTTSAYAYLTGDVQGDGVRDVRWNISLYAGTPSADSGGWIDGRTGRIHVMPDATVPVGTVDGAGVDFARASTVSGVLTVETWDGRTGALLWRTVVKLPSTRSVPYAIYAAAVDKDRCGDVGIARTSDDAYVMLLDGATGRPRLTLHATGREQMTVVTPVVRSRIDRNRCR